MIQIADRHLGRAAIGGMLLALGVLVTLATFFELIDQLGDVGKGRFSVIHALGATALSIPGSLYDAFPVASVVGAMLGVGGLAASSELVAWRAAGLSRLRIALGVVLSTVLLLLPVLLLGEWLAPAGERMSRALKVRTQAGGLSVTADEAIWVRDGRRFVNARRPLAIDPARPRAVTLTDVNVFEVEDGRLRVVFHADLGRHEGGVWRLENLRRTTFGDGRVAVETQAAAAWESLVDPSILATAISRPRHLPLVELKRYVSYLQENELDAAAYRAAFWLRAAYPLTAVVVVLAGMVFVFGSLRAGGLGQRLFVGMLIGAVFLLVNRIAVSLSEVYRLDPALMAFAPSVALAAVSVWALRREA